MRFRLPKNQVKSMFKLGVCKLSDEEYTDYLRFISGVMIGSGYETKDYFEDFIPFLHNCKPDWPIIYKKYKETGLWPVYTGTEIEWLE